MTRRVFSILVLGLGAAALLVLLEVRHRRPEPPRAREVLAQAAEDPVAPGVAASSVETRTPAAPPELDPGPVSSPRQEREETSPTSVQVRFLDELRVPLEGVSFFVVDAGEDAAVSGRDGIAMLALGLSIAPMTGRTLTFEARGDGLAVDRRRARVTGGEPLWLEDWTLLAAGSVEGHVLDEDGNGLAGVEVACASEPVLTRGWADLRRAEIGVLARPGARATSGPDGAFRLEDVPAGAIRLVAVAEDRPAALSQGIDVPVGGLATGVELEMEASDGGTTLAGVVLDPHGAPVPRAPYRVRSSGTEYGMHADEEGRFEFRALDKRPVELIASDPLQRFGDASRRGIVPGTRGIELRLLEAPAIELAVRSPGGEPISQFAVFLLAEPARDVLALFASEEREGGRFATAAPSESFLVEVRANGWKPLRLGPFPPDEPRSIECKLEPARGLVGLVTAGGEPVAGARVALHVVLTSDDTYNGHPIRLELEPAVATDTGRDGAFLLSVAEPGSYVLLVEAEGYALSESGPLSLTPDTEAETAVELDAGGTLAVRVHSSQGASVAGLRVVCSRGDGRARTSRTDERGELLLERLTPGPWWIALSEVEIDPATGARTFGTSPAREAPSNCRVQSGQTTDVDLWLEDPAERCRLSGRLTIDGKPASGWQVALDQEGKAVSDGAFDEPGVFHIGVAEPGAFRLRLAPRTEDPSAMLVILETVELAEGERSWSYDLHTGVLEGTVHAVEPEALLFFRIRAGARELMAPIATGSDGRFRCSLAPAGAGEVLRYDPSRPLEEQSAHVLRTVTVETGRTTTIDL